MHSMSEWDWTGMAEKDFNDLCIYHVPDKPVDKTSDNMAIASLPRNLFLRPSGEIPKVRVCAYGVARVRERVFVGIAELLLSALIGVHVNEAMLIDWSI